jgi:hypothetical protein
VLVSDRFYHNYVLQYKQVIAERYSRFQESIEDMLYVCVLDYAIESMHYFYICEWKTLFGCFVVGDNLQHLQTIMSSVTEHVPEFESDYARTTTFYDSYEIHGAIDHVHNDSSVFIHFSMSKEIRLQDSLNFVVQDFVRRGGECGMCSAIVYNLATGNRHILRAEVCPAIIDTLLLA